MEKGESSDLPFRLEKKFVYYMKKSELSYEIII